MELKCDRCGKEMPEIKHILHDIIYLGESKPKQCICEKCHEEFVEWYKLCTK